jgi:hypothetical protein
MDEAVTEQAEASGTDSSSGLSPDQRSIQAAGRLAAELMQRPEWRSLTAALVSMRQGYAIAYRELQRLCDGLRSGYEERGEPMPLVEDFLIQYAMWEASKPFTEHDWWQSMFRSVLPWLADVIDQHAAAEEEEARAEQQRQEKERRARPLDIGFSHSLGADGPTLARERSLVLVGYRPAVLWLLDRLCNHVLSATHGPPCWVVRFLTTAPGRDGARDRLVRVGGTAWHGFANSWRQLERSLAEHLEDQLTSPPDLVVVDDLAWANTTGFVGRPGPARAGDAHRHVRRWCDEVGAALVGGVLLEDDGPVDITAPEYEQLRTFTYLRPVHVLRPEKGQCRVLVGNSATLDVDEESLRSYGRKVILPGGKVE